MKICPKCGREHEKSGIFCSRSCANSRTFSSETNKLKSDTNKKYWNTLDESQKEDKLTILKRVASDKSEDFARRLLYRDWEALSIQAKRFRVIMEQSGKCNRCGLSEWQGHCITFEYEHKDGNNKNNSRDNVECLCPNCHSLTSTWRGRKNSISRRNGKIIEYLKTNDVAGE